MGKECCGKDCMTAEQVIDNFRRAMERRGTRFNGADVLSELAKHGFTVERAREPTVGVRARVASESGDMSPQQRRAMMTNAERVTWWRDNHAQKFPKIASTPREAGRAWATAFLEGKDPGLPRVPVVPGGDPVKEDWIYREGRAEVFRAAKVPGQRKMKPLDIGRIENLK